MASFTFKAKNNVGKVQKGALDADNKQSAVQQLRDRGLIVLEMNERNLGSHGKGGKSFSIFNGVPDKEKLVFTRQLAIMTEAGLPITQALHSLLEETTNKKLLTTIQSITNDVEGGQSLSGAFSKHLDVFSPLYVSVLKAGEKSGKVDEVLNSLANQIEKDYDIKGKVKGALSYPIVVLVAMFVIVSLIMIFIIPQIKAVFDENNAKLPVLTQVVIAISNVMRHQFFLIIGGVGAVIYAYRLYNRTTSGKYVIDSLKLRVPIFGVLLKRVAIARFARIFSTLMGAGLPMLEIFETANEVLGNAVFQKEMNEVAKEVQNGVEISTAMKKQPHIPRMMIQLTAVGEKSGNIDVIYNNLAQFMEREVDNITRNMTSLLEPILMLIMGAVIGTIVIALLLPIYTLTSSIL